MPHKVNMHKVHLDWCMYLVKKMQDVIESNISDKDKLDSITWYVKQCLKVEPDYYNNVKR